MARRRRLSPSAYFNGIREGHLATLSRAITLMESRLAADQVLAAQLLERCLPHSGDSFRVGITGAPGVGKSSFVEAFGLHWLEADPARKLAVLTVDPSSKAGGGSILGDKTRMPQLSTHPRAFIRPSPAGEALGGVNWRTREAVMICESWGAQLILVETVGVGQGETIVHGMVDFFLLLQLAGAGDELQGIKRGIMEVADGVLITKADGDNQLPAQQAVSDYRQALKLLPPPPSDRRAPVQKVSAHTGAGLEEVQAMLTAYREATEASGYFAQRRREQRATWFEESLRERLYANFFQSERIQEQLAHYRQAVGRAEMTPFAAARALVDGIQLRTSGDD